MTTPASVPVKRSVASGMRPVTSVFGALQHEVDRLFDEFQRVSWPTFAGDAGLVRIDMADTKDGLELTAELPGLEQKDVQVTVTDHVLTISGEKRAEKEEKDRNYHLVERSYGAFSRSIELPSDAEADKIQAVIANGVLKVTVPRLAKAAPKTIEVRTAA